MPNLWRDGDKEMITFGNRFRWIGILLGAIGLSVHTENVDSVKYFPTEISKMPKKLEYCK